MRLEECNRCGLHHTSNKPVPGYGNKQADLFFIGEAPGENEDREGQPFVGRSGKFLTQIMSKSGIYRQDVYITNLVKCRPPENRDPTKDEIFNCEQWLIKEIEEIKPKKIICIGRLSAYFFLEKSPTRFGEIANQKFAEYHGIPVYAIYHPAYLLRKRGMEDGMPLPSTIHTLRKMTTE